MPRTPAPKPNDRLTQREVAHALGYTYESFRTLRARKGPDTEDLPAPSGEWNGSPYWHRSDIELWQAERTA